MKIRNKEIKAALVAGELSLSPLNIARMRRSLEAAFKVRKARKKKKSAKERPSILDEDQQEAMRQFGQPVHRLKVGDRVYRRLCGAGAVAAIDEDAPTVESSTPTWNGKLEVGKRYRTRGGQEVTITGKGARGISTNKVAAIGVVRGLLHDWRENGEYFPGVKSFLDIVGPWDD